MLATFTVTNNIDGPVGAAGDLPGSLRQAIFDANALDGADMINFDASVFTGGDESLIRLTAGELRITESLSLDGSMSVGVTITGDAIGDDITLADNITDVTASADAFLLSDNTRVLNFTSGSGELAISGLAITGGSASGVFVSNGSGGGILSESSRGVDLTNVVVSGNTTTSFGGQGGGISSLGSVSLNSSVVSGNSSGDAGGGIHVAEGSVTLIDSVVSSNSTYDGAGGGIFANGVTLVGSTVSGNSTSGVFARGGGIFTDGGGFEFSAVTVNNSVVSGNSTSGESANGGGIYSRYGVTVTNGTVSGNQTTGERASGGGISVDGGPVTLTNSTVSGNSAGFGQGYSSFDTAAGGGIYLLAGALTLSNSTVSGNTSVGTGGGIRSGQANVTLTNGSAVVGNSGGGISSTEGDVIVTDSEVSRNSGGSGVGVYASRGDVRITNSTVSENVGFGDGGGVNARYGALTVTNSTVSGNVSVRGGGIFSYDGTVSLSNSSVSGNTTIDVGFSFSTYGAGGGIYSNRGEVSLVNSTVSANSTVGEDGGGGGIFTNSGDVGLTNSVVADNTTTGQRAAGGGISGGGTVNLLGSTVSGNATTGSQAAGGGILSRGFMTLTNSTVSGNSTAGIAAPGGGIYASGNLYLLGSTVAGNTTVGADSSGGGIFSNGSVYLADSSVDGNTAGGGGGGVFSYFTNATGSTVSGNTTLGSSGRGGGIYANIFAIVNDTTVSGNTTIGQYASGGGISTLTGEVSVSNSTIVGNTAAGSDASGGGISVGTRDSVVINSTISGNTAGGVGGGIGQAYFGDNLSLNIFNSIIAGNSDRGAAPDLVEADDLNAQNNIIGDSTSVSLTTGGNNFVNVDFSAVVETEIVNGRVVPRLADNGGSVETVALLQDSPAINTGNNDLAFSVGFEAQPLVNDQRGEGFDRIRFGTIDIGAFESTVNAAGSLVVTTATDVVDAFDGETSLREAIDFANDPFAGNLGIGDADNDGSQNDTITFNSNLNGQTILLNDELVISSSLAILGPGADQLSISGFNTNRVFAIGAPFYPTPIDVVISDVTVRDAGIGVQTPEQPIAGIFNTGNLSLDGVSIESNQGNGLIHEFGSLLVASSTFANNFAFDGGGIFVGSGEANFVNSTFSNNTATDSGGGIFVDSDADVTIRNSTITGNVAGVEDGSFASGGGIFSDGFGNLTLHNTIVAGNLSGVQGERVTNDTSGFFTADSSHNLIGDANASLDNGFNGNIVGDGGGGTIPIASILDPTLADNGGSTRTHLLVEDSPAIDAGDNGLAIDANDNPLLTDQRGTGFDRIVSDVVDIGAFEFVEAVNDLGTTPVITNIVRDEGGVLERPDLISTYAVTFDQDVSVAQDDLVIFNDTTGTLVDSSGVVLTYDSNSFTAIWNFNSLLDAAFYTFELSSDISGVVGGLALDGNGDGTGGDNRSEEVYVALPGDANLDGTVDVLDDAFALVGNLGTTGGATWAQGDFNNDGNVDVLNDAFILVGNLGESVVRPASGASVLPPASMEANPSSTSSALQRTPVLIQVNQDSSELAVDTRKENVIPVAAKTSALAGSQSLDEAFASEDWLI